jgi:hypothetical protein
MVYFTGMCGFFWVFFLSRAKLEKKQDVWYPFRPIHTQKQRILVGPEKRHISAPASCTV